MGSKDQAESAGKRSAMKRRQSGVRIPADTLHELGVYAAKNDLMRWEAQDRLLRQALGLAPRKKE